MSTKNFWWMYIKAAVRGTMSKCGCLTLGWTPGAGGKKVAYCWTKSCEAKNDLLPHCLFAVSLDHHQYTGQGHNKLLDQGLRGLPHSLFAVSLVFCTNHGVLVLLLAAVQLRRVRHLGG